MKKKNTNKTVRIKDPGKSSHTKNATRSSEADSDEKYDGKDKKKGR